MSYTPSTDLLFAQRLDTTRPVDLVFGAAGGGDVVVLSATLSAPLRVLAPVIVADYDSNVSRPFVSGCATIFTETERRRSGAAVSMQQADRAGAFSSGSWGDADPIRASNSSSSGDLSRGGDFQSGAWSDADSLRATSGAGWKSFARDGLHSGSLWARAEPMPGVSAESRHRVALPIRVTRPIRHGDGILLPRSMSPRWDTAVRSGSWKRVPWGESWRPRPGVSPAPSDNGGPEPKPPCYTPTTDLLFWEKFAEGHRADLLFRCPETPVSGTVVVPILEVYIVLNDATLRRIDNGLDLPATSMSLSIDADSWTWGFSASLPAASLDSLERGSSRAPVELEATINGIAFRVLVESISRERTFGRASISVKGRGIAATLDDPYAPILSFGNTEARTAQQLAGDALTLNGVGLGWSLDWRLTDWLVPAGVWLHNGTHIGALNTIAKAAGGYVQAHRTSKTLRVLPSFPYVPWDWGSLPVDYEIPAAVATREGIEWIERPGYNRVHVSGQSAGILGVVTRAGTAGDILAPMVTDSLITHADAARQRGRSILSDTGTKAVVTLRVPVLPETGVIEPGKFVTYHGGDESRVGLVRAVDVSIDYPSVWQTLRLDTYV